MSDIKAQHEAAMVKWRAARAAANTAAERSRAIYAQSRGPKDPAAIEAKAAAESAIAVRDAARREMDALAARLQGAR